MHAKRIESFGTSSKWLFFLPEIKENLTLIPCKEASTE